MIQQATDAPPAAPGVTFIGAHGNAGDAVITLATTPWIRSLRLEEDTIIFKGGGLGHHANLHELLDSLPREKPLVVAPTSLDAASADILATFPRAHVFCRGAVSLELAEARGISCELAHDLALRTDCTPWRDLPAAGTLNCFRGDVESATNHRPVDNDDISLAAHRAWTPDNCKEAAHDFIRTIAGYRTIHTDRLHVGIIAGLLGRETHLYAGTDHKIPEVYAHSLRHLENVTLHRAEETHVGPAPRAVIIHQSGREDRKASVLELFHKVGNCRMLEAVAPLWESAPANVAVRGCSLSHLRALRLHGGNGPLLVLEDDAKVVPAAYGSWLRTTTLPDDCGAVLLGGDVAHHTPGPGGWHEVLPPFWGSQAVVYNTPLLAKTPFLINALEIIASNQVGPHGNGFGLCYESILLMALQSVGLKLHCRTDHAFTTHEDTSARSGKIEPPRMASVGGRLMVDG
ncbi:MAG: polysaccharide pyruvyl transferase family protein [Akkermansiaceae bacterium]|nr:polysaccharide pyruvyl transferase family protein [Akkermansiaceae bacterium]